MTNMHRYRGIVREREIARRQKAWIALRAELEHAVKRANEPGQPEGACPAHLLEIKTEDPVRKLTADEVAKMPVQERCLRILDEFDEWLAVRRLQYELKYEDLPQLNDAFRGYFAGTRTAQGSGELLRSPFQSPGKPLQKVRAMELKAEARALQPSDGTSHRHATGARSTDLMTETARALPKDSRTLGVPLPRVSGATCTPVEYEMKACPCPYKQSLAPASLPARDLLHLVAMNKPALPYATLRCYACDGKACGVRDRRPEGGIVEAACKRHMDPTIRAYAACYICLGARPTRAIDSDLLVHKKCHAEDCAS